MQKASAVPMVSTIGFISSQVTRIFFYIMNIFMGISGKGLGACHQTGWTALVAELINWQKPATASKKQEENAPGIKV